MLKENLKIIIIFIEFKSTVCLFLLTNQWQDTSYILEDLTHN